jgi:hypothetical protein
MLSPSPVDLVTLASAKSYLSSDGTVNTSATSDDDNIQRIITGISRMFLRRTGNYSGAWQSTLQSPFVQPVSVTEVRDGNDAQELYTRMFPIQSVQSLVINNVQVPLSIGFGSYGYQVSDDGKRIVLMGGTSSRGYTSQYYLIRGNSWPRFLRGRQNVVVQYTAGFPMQQVDNELQQVPASGPYVVQVDEPWIVDLGVQYFVGGAPLQQVQVSPAPGQYFVQGGGDYLFNAADANAQVQISYGTDIGCPEDLRWAALTTVAYNYKKHDRLGLKSESLSGPGGGTTSYSDLEVPVEALGTLRDYRREAIVL